MYVLRKGYEDSNPYTIAQNDKGKVFFLSSPDELVEQYVGINGTVKGGWVGL
jgi:hypothetical protein